MLAVTAAAFLLVGSPAVTSIAASINSESRTNACWICFGRIRLHPARSREVSRFAGIEQLLHEIRLTDWENLLADAECSSPGKSNSLFYHGSFLLDATLDIHHLIADGFLNHQIHMRPDAQPTLFALKNAL